MIFQTEQTVHHVSDSRVLIRMPSEAAVKWCLSVSKSSSLKFHPNALVSGTLAQCANSRSFTLKRNLVLICTSVVV